MVFFFFSWRCCRRVELCFWQIVVGLVVADNTRSCLDAVRSADLAGAERCFAATNVRNVRSALALIRWADVAKAVELYESSSPVLARLSREHDCGGLADVYWTAEFTMRKLVAGGDRWKAHCVLGTLLADSGALPEASRHFAAAAAINNTPALHFRTALAVAAVYDSKEHLSKTRKELEAGVDGLASLRLESLDHLSMPGTFYIAYMGFGDAALMRTVQRAYAEAYPPLARAPLATTRSRGRRIGFVSSLFFRHSVCKLFCGIIRGLAARGFDVTMYSAADEPDEWTRWAAEGATEVILPRGTLIANRHLVDVDVLVFTDIGMETRNLAWAHARLARWQIATWGHPHTPGLPDTIDFFVSSDLYDEPQDRYAEQLVKFDSLGFFFPGPRFSEDARALSLPSIDNASIVYACPQFLPKFHPDFDEVLLALLRDAPRRDAVLAVTYEPKKTLWMVALRSRLEERLSPEERSRLLFIPLLRGDAFFAFLRKATVLLDPFPFGGGVTTLEAAAACRLAVTAPGLQTVPALASGMYRHAGLPRGFPLVVSSAEEYVEAAHHLAAHAAVREELEERLCASSADPAKSLFESAAAVDEWAAFLDRLLSSSSSSSSF